ncbi:general stress protein [Polymorphobacter glacialis]|uniref:General stress protein n=1 Tax=Sandarakinorhabdus glacialis TaxID=1614636 RepID=A0A916ZK75_9SPHN|nr:pyridoxamine 5'-phosphate oxidase family protein [Polymorphobacter glacialis]GGE01922.1 general stress protein [Polymorphobacter glacialis]
MASDQEIAGKFWKTLDSDRTVMLGLEGHEDGHLRPMTAQVEDNDTGRGPIWFFTSDDNGIVEAIRGGASGRATATLVSKGHELFASFDGTLAEHNDQATIDRLWNPFVAAWYSGKDDPKLVLLRMEPGNAVIWLNENNLFAAVKMLIGIDPKVDAKDKVAQVSLG